MLRAASMSASSPPTTQRRALVEALAVAAAVTGIVTLESMLVPEKHVATAVGLTFLTATWAMVWRRDDATVVRSGLSFGGLVLGGSGAERHVLGSFARAFVWAAALSAIVFVPFFFGWRWWWHPGGHFVLDLKPASLANDVAGQVLMIALPEEAFYRGYLQSRLDDAFDVRFDVAGARLSPSIFLTSAIFALGHLATIHDPVRLAVFFPSLLFGWLRARTRGVGAGVLFHASCNIYSELLGRGFGMY